MSRTGMPSVIQIARSRSASTASQIAAAAPGGCLLYTSDAADERSSVDLGGRRIIKKKTQAEAGCGARYTTK